MRIHAATPAIVTAAFFALLLMSTAQRVTPTIASDVIRERLRLTGSEFGVLAAMSAFVFGFTQFPGGYLSDVFGATHVIKVAALVSAAGTLLFLASPTYPLALAGRAVFGVADSVVFVSMMRYAVGPRAGGGAFQIGKVQAAVTVGFAASAVVGLGLTKATFQPLFGGVAVAQAVLALLVPAGHRPPARAIAGPALDDITAVLQSRQFWASVAANVGLFAPFLAWTSGWAVPYLTLGGGLGINPARAVVIADSLAALSGALLLGRLSDALRRRRALLLVGAAAMTSAWALLVLLGPRGSTPATVALSLIVGFSFPACNSSLVLAKESFRLDRAGMVLGLSNMASSIAAAMLGAACGVGLDAAWQGGLDNGIRVYPPHAYTAISLVMLAGCVPAIVGGLAARETHARQSGAPVNA